MGSTAGHVTLLLGTSLSTNVFLWFAFRKPKSMISLYPWSMRGMVSRIRRIVPSAPRRTKRLITCLSLASMQGNRGAACCVALTRIGSLLSRGQHSQSGGWMQDVKCLKNHKRGLTRQFFSSLGGYGRNATPVSSTMWPTRRLRQRGRWWRKGTSGSPWALRHSRCSWWLRWCLRGRF